MFKEDFIAIAAMITAVLVAILLVLLAVNLFESHRCSNWSELTGYRSEFRVMDACYVEHEGRMRRWDEYLAIQRQVEVR